MVVRVVSDDCVNIADRGDNVLSITYDLSTGESDAGAGILILSGNGEEYGDRRRGSALRLDGVNDSEYCVETLVTPNIEGEGEMRKECEFAAAYKDILNGKAPEWVLDYVVILLNRIELAYINRNTYNETQEIYTIRKYLHDCTDCNYLRDSLLIGETDSRDADVNHIAINKTLEGVEVKWFTDKRLEYTAILRPATKQKPDRVEVLYNIGNHNKADFLFNKLYILANQPEGDSDVIVYTL